MLWESACPLLVLCRSVFSLMLYRRSEFDVCGTFLLSSFGVV